MKTTFNIQHSTPNAQRPARPSPSRLGVECSVLNVPRSPNRQSEQGIALIITLILLSVTLVMALAFLAISNRERSSVTTTTDTVTARLAADSALAAAEAQIVANMLTSSNAYNYGLVVSTNYINANGFTPGYANPENVNYDFVAGSGNALTEPQMLQNLANLYYSPRPPVFIPTNAAGATDFRYYLDLNRNGEFDASGVVTNYDSLGNVILDGNGNPVTSHQEGDPQWIGVLERPDTTYGPDNKFLSRYAYICLPVGNTLDLNYIHNQVMTTAPNDGYFRNQGVGSWEINLAAFLADLNTNQWGQVIGNPTYYYYQYQPFNNQGSAFYDAQGLLAYRYNYNPLPWLSTVLPNYPNPVAGSPVDIFPFGPAMTGTAIPSYLYANLNKPWPGADSTNHYFDLTSDLYDPAKTERNVVAPALGFTDRLLQAGTNASTYDRYTFYRMLAQLGTDSTPEQGKMNLNYDNLDRGQNGFLDVNGTASATNFVAWTSLSPLNFFTNAADRMLKLYTTNWFENSPSNYLATYYGINGYNYYHSYLDGNGNTVTITNDPTGLGLTNIPLFGMTNTIPAFGIGNIPVRVNGSFVYSPAVNRLLQLAANIYDASTNSFYPDVFRPLFSRDVDGNLFVTGYTNVVSVSGTADGAFSQPIDAGAVVPPVGNQILLNVYGVPWIIGAKKYMPNFNQFYMLNEVQVTRKLQVNRPRIEGFDRTTAGDFSTNQLFFMSITNKIGYSLWNSYRTNYLGMPNVVVNDYMRMVLTNNNSMVTNAFAQFNFPLTTLNSGWPGSAWNITQDPAARQASQYSFVFGTTNFDFLPTSSLQFSLGSFSGFGGDGLGFNTADTSLPNFPGFGLATTNWLQAYIVDNGHVLDYVQFNGPSGVRNLANELADPKYTGTFQSLANPVTVSYMWSTNGSGPSGNGPNWGVINQIYVSQNGPNAAQVSQWKSPPNMPPGLSGIPAAEAAFFAGFFNLSWQYNGQTYYNTNLSVQAPFTPQRTIYQYTMWQANDPLVHYLASDLNDYEPGKTGLHKSDDPVNQQLPTPILNAVGDRYQPWGRIDQFAGLPNVDTNAFNLAFHDPLVWGSDNWDFPDNKYPTVGWLGRVHRGTPWQTVYLKAANVLGEYVMNASSTNYIGTNTWAQWTGDTQLSYGQYYDAANSAPIQDRLLFDVFTTAPNDNATRGQLSVNVGAPDGPSLAAWSAVLSGVQVLTNTSVNPSFNAAPAYTNLVIDPAGVNGTNSALWQIVNAINRSRATLVNSDGVTNSFEHMGSILATPQLTEQSPFLNRSSAAQIDNGISDELYEWLPQQTLSLLRADNSPRYVIYSYGQTLTPAPGSVVTASGSYFGMITNYSVVAETATRTVVRVENAGTPHPHIVVESSNVLPPD